MKPLIILIPLLFCGCDDKPDPYQAPVQAPPEVPHQRFKVELQGRFNAGFQSHVRDIVIITDTTNGHQYLGITGVGVTEMWTETHGAGKTAHSVTVEE